MIGIGSGVKVAKVQHAHSELSHRKAICESELVEILRETGAAPTWVAKTSTGRDPTIFQGWLSRKILKIGVTGNDLHRCA